MEQACVTDQHFFDAWRTPGFPLPRIAILPSIAPPPTTTANPADDALVALWLHGRPPGTIRAYAAERRRPARLPRRRRRPRSRDDCDALCFGKATFAHLGSPSWPFRPGIHRYPWLPIQDLAHQSGGIEIVSEKATTKYAGYQWSLPADTLSSGFISYAVLSGTTTITLSPGIIREY